MKEKKVRITERSEDFSRWYTDVIAAAKLADHSPVKGCMVIRPEGYAIWESIQGVLDGMFKATGHKNAYFPLLIPESFLKREAEHVEGFAPECAVVTRGGGEELEEPLVIRPTSETIIWHMYKKWIMSFRDLPLLINQWCNVVRWEMRTRLFLRTTEFLWQEGHTAHATFEDAEEETLKILEIYRTFAEDYLAIPVISGRKSDREKFAGALHTYCIEAMMQDKRALQAGTSHNLGTNFARAFDVTFQDTDGKVKDVWATSWGVSTRLIGALIMTHSDDSGLVLPPNIAPVKMTVIPIFKTEDEKSKLMEYLDPVLKGLDPEITYHVDVRDNVRVGWKFTDFERSGVPLRLEAGPRDLKEKKVVLVRRDTGDKEFVPASGAASRIKETLADIQKSLFERALGLREANTHGARTLDEFKDTLEEKGGFILAGWCGSGECEERVKEETKATIRCLPFDAEQDEGECLVCREKSPQAAVFAKAY